ncbi:hypothetical protein [Comamonas sp. NoAH]|uniref:hypothetical protein n=1 Tax=Comamonas halotolerans TaxID=3041496 RepID=UPI0024E08BE8|nr:hypothetical protein [Comamonas sp. NoAH]
MKSFISTVAALVILAAPAWAHDDHAHTQTPSQSVNTTQAAPKVDAHTQEDIERHRGMARAHEQAAQCLATGTKYEECQKQLQASCKGLALGKNCGMRHAH